MVGVEIDMVVDDSLKALELYEKIFQIERLEVTNFPKGQNEVVFTLYGVRFHLLDENLEFGLRAPSIETPNSMWFNILVPDIKEVYSKAMEAGCTSIQEIVEMPEFAGSNAIFSDGLGYEWMLHQIDKVVSFEDRIKLFEDKMGQV